MNDLELDKAISLFKRLSTISKFLNTLTLNHSGGLVMKIYVASFNFSPGHLSHLIAWYKLFNFIGYETKLLLHNSYQNLIEKEFDVEYINSNLNDRFEVLKTDVLLIYNPYIKNHSLAKKFKEKGAKIVYIYHEPWDSWQGYFKEGVKQAFKASAAHFFSTKLLSLSDSIIVPSKFALKLYEKSDFKYNSNVCVIPLIFDDETKGFELTPENKIYFSYIGTACKGHGFEEFLNFLLSFDKKELRDLPFKFQISTKTDISDLMNERVRFLIKEGFLKINHGKPLKNSEINQAYANSFAVWNLYNRSTQSGVLPKAQMFGTAPIASTIGSFPEFIQNGANGYLMNDYNFTTLKKTVYSAFENREKLFENSRSNFFQKFYFANYANEMKHIVENMFLSHDNC